MHPIERKLRKRIAQKRKEYLELKKVNLDPEKQHSWDDWMRVSGYLDGLEEGLGYLVEYIEEAKKGKS